MNAREAMHLIELRSGPQGHPAYRRVAQEMHRAIDEVAGHHAIAAAMSHVDSGSAELERLEAERRAEARRTASRNEKRHRKFGNLVTRENRHTSWSHASAAPLSGPGADCVSYAQSQTPRGDDVRSPGLASPWRGGCCERRREARGVE